MRTFWTTFVLTALLALSATAQLTPKNLPRLHDGRLLSGYPGFGLSLTRDTETEIFNQEQREIWNAIPSLSAHGLLVAGARLAGKTEWLEKSVYVGVYSATAKRWNDVSGLVSYVSAIAITADGSKLAYASDGPDGSGPAMLTVVDLSGSEIKSFMLGNQRNTSLSWSPAGDRIVFDQVQNHFTIDQIELVSDRRGGTLMRYKPATQEHPVAEIKVLNVLNGRIETIALGAFPSWSPSGEWIAYLVGPNQPGEWVGTYPAHEVHVMRPDGSDNQTAAIVHTKGTFFSELRNLHFSPVWSPNSKALLVNENADWDKGTYDVYRLDLGSNRLYRIARNKAPVFGWAAP